MKIGLKPKNTLFFERFKKNWRLKPSPRTWTFSPGTKAEPKAGAPKPGQKIWDAQLFVERSV